MFGLLNPQLYFYFLLFLIAVSFSWFIPGWISLSVVKFKSTSLKFLLSMPVGMALWGIQGYLLGYANLRFLTYIYILVFTYLFIKTQKAEKFKDFKKVFLSFKKQPYWFMAAIGLSAFIQIYAHLGSGLVSDQGLPFYFVNSVDGVLHLSYIQEISNNFPPHEPGAVGLPLQNYHYWSDLVQAELVRVWFLPTIHVFFQYAPILISTWTTILFLRLISYLGGSKKSRLVALFLITFGGDAAYLLTQILHKTWGNDVSSLDSGVSFYFNIPQVYARFVFLAVIFLLTKWWKTRSFKTGIILTMLIASLFGFKVYYAIYAVFGFCFVIGIEMISLLIENLKKKSFIPALSNTLAKSKRSILLVTILAIVSLVIYLPVNKAAGGLSYSYFEWPRLLLSATNIDYADWFLRMQVYRAYNNLRNIFIFNLYAIFLTFVAVYGTRMIGMIPMFKVKNEHLKRLLWFFIPSNIIFILLGLFTLQTSGGLNIFNFLIVPIFSFNVIAALNLGKLNTKVFVPLIIIFAVLTVPRSFNQINHFYDRYSNQKADAVISNDELEVYDFLRNQTDDLVVQKSINEYYNYQTMYVSFMSNHPTYIGGVEMLISHNQPTDERVELVKQAEEKSEVDSLQKNGITHYIVETEEFEKPTKWFYEPAFQNKTWTVVDIRR